MEAIKNTILIIEDDAGLNELLSEKVQESGYHTASIFSASAAFDWLAEQTPYLMLLDYSLPDMNGKEFITQLQTKSDIIPPFILATGQGDERIAVEMMKLGARDYIVKDSNYLEMIPRVVSRVCSEIENTEKLKLAEKEVKRIGLHFQAIIEKAPDGFVLLDANGQFKYVSPSARKMFGYSESEVITSSPNDFTHPDDLPMVLENLQRIFQNPAFIPTLEYRFIHKKGKSVWVESTFSNLLADENVQSILINFRDITERKLAEEKVLESRFAYMNLFNSVSEAIYLQNEDGTFIDVNDGAVRMYGYSRDEFIGNTPEMVTAPGLNDLARVFELVKKVYETGISESYEFWGKRKNGQIFPKEVITGKVKYFGKDVIITTARDITERKLAETHTIRAKDRLTRAEFASKSGNWELHLDSMQIKASKGAIKLYGVDRKQLYFDEIKDFPLPEYRPMLDLALKNLIEKNEPYNIDFKLKTADTGEIIDVHTEAVYDAEKRVLFGVIQDVTEKKLAEKALKDSEEKFRLMFENNPQSMFIYDLETLLFLDVNNAAQEQYGFSKDEFLTKTIPDLHPKEDLPEILARVENTRNGRNSDGIMRHKKKNGDIIYVDVISTSIITKGRNARHAMAIDVTKRKLAEQALKSSEELYRNLVIRIPDGVYKSTPEGKFIEVNPAMVEMLGYKSKEEMMALNIKNDLYFDPQDRVSLILDQSSEETGIYQLKKKDGSAIWVEDHGWYRHDDNGILVSHEGVLRDVTDRKLSEEALKEKMDELVRFHRLTVGRELKMIELKIEINDLLEKAGQRKKYVIVE